MSREPSGRRVDGVTRPQPRIWFRLLFSLLVGVCGLFGVSFSDELTLTSEGLAWPARARGVGASEDAPEGVPHGPPQSKVQEAYEHNRAGMVNMSMARFEEAIAEFNQAAALLPDYQIRGRPLIYTPIFMTGWAFEKIGRLNEACEHYRRFLEIAPPETVEETKAQHAREVLEKCRHS